LPDFTEYRLLEMDAAGIDIQVPLLGVLLVGWEQQLVRGAFGVGNGKRLFQCDVSHGCLLVARMWLL
jgi:hypothetical protein